MTTGRYASTVMWVLTVWQTAFPGRLSLDIYASGFERVPIAVTSFVAEEGAELTRDRPWQVIADDLDFCGRFAVTRGTPGDSAAFVSHGVSLAVEGTYNVHGDSVRVECALRDLFKDEIVLEERFDVLARECRRVAHHFANAVFELVYNERGPFESRILLVRDLGAVKSVFLMDYDGHHMRQATFGPGIDILPCFIDSSAFLLVSYRHGKPDIFRASVGSDDPVALVGTRHTDSSPAYSGIQDLIVYSSSHYGNAEIAVCDGNGANRRRLTFNKAIDTSPCWSPEGYHIAFISDRSGQPQLYVMDAEGMNVRRLTYVGGYQDSPAWSPCGDKIAYTSLNEGKTDIWVIDVDGSRPVRITDVEGKNEYPAWSPDASHIAFQSTRRRRSDIYTVHADGTGLRRLTRVGNATMPDWSQF
jgi:TolB protein